MPERSGSEATAFWTVAPGRGELRRETLPPLEAGQVRVRMLASAVSRGTESLVFQGRVPASEAVRMRCPFQSGDFPFPVKYGYCAVGRVEAGADALLGRRVFCLHPHQDLFQVPAAMVMPLPDALPDARATLAANMETALNGLWDARLLLGERVVVLGAGLVGLFSARLASQVPGVAVRLLDPDPGRRAAAAALGLATEPPDEGWADLVVEASGNPAALSDALRYAGFEARILELSWFGDRPAELALGAAFHARRLSIVSSQVGAVAPAMRARRSHADRLKQALDLLADPLYDGLIGRRVRFADLPAAMPSITGTQPTEAGGGLPATIVTYAE